VTHDASSADDGEDGDALAGRWYASTFRVGQNAFEFKVDCGRNPPEGDVTTLYFRVIASPSNARELFRQLGVSLLHYADAFGPIDENGEPRTGGLPR
jgi:hypothetical protein